MTHFEEYKKQTEPEKYKKAENWGIAIGLQQVDGLTPSKYLIEVAKDNIEGKISIDEANEQIKRYYKQNPAQTLKEHDEKEADEVSARIAKLLSTHAFTFSPAELIGIHKELFQGILDDKIAGKIRTYDIVKEEEILNGGTVLYGRATTITDMLNYDFKTEKEFDYNGLSKKEIVEHLVKFISGIWQIHPFAEGNTRTTAVFTIKYLYTLGFETNNDLFEQHSKYFRNALVRANYQNLDKGIPYTMTYLNKFFDNLLLDEKNALDNREMQIWDDSEKSSEKSSEKNALNSTKSKILKEIKANPIISAKQLADILGITSRAVEKNLAQLRESNTIRRIGPDKGGHWEIIEK